VLVAAASVGGRDDRSDPCRAEPWSSSIRGGEDRISKPTIP